MIVGLMNRPQPEGPKLTDILALINASKDNNAGKSDPTEVLLKGLQLGRELAGGGGETGMLDVAKTGLEALMPLIQQGRQPQPANAPAAPAVRRLPAPDAPALVRPPATSAQPGAGTQPGEGEEVKALQQLKWITAQLNILVNHAAREKNPELYAEVMLDNLPTFITLEDIAQHIGADDALDKLASIDSRVQQFRPWFEEFRKAVQAFLSDDGEEEGDEDDDPGASDIDAPAGEPA